MATTFIQLLKVIAVSLNGIKINLGNVVFGFSTVVRKFKSDHEQTFSL